MTSVAHILGLISGCCTRNSVSIEYFLRANGGASRKLRCATSSNGRLVLTSESSLVSLYRRSGSLCPPSATRKSRSGDTSVKEEQLDPDLREGLNEVANEALKVMLLDDDKLTNKFREKLDSSGEYLVKENQLDAAKFMFVIKGMLDHKIYPEVDDLSGPYKKAFDRIWSMVEDSGWLVKAPNTDGNEVDMVDDELIPPVLNAKY